VCDLRKGKAKAADNNTLNPGIVGISAELIGGFTLETNVPDEYRCRLHGNVSCVMDFAQGNPGYSCRKRFPQRFRMGLPLLRHSKSNSITCDLLSLSRESTPRRIQRLAFVTPVASPASWEELPLDAAVDSTDHRLGLAHGAGN
jgi:hypothetical protein